MTGAGRRQARAGGAREGDSPSSFPTPPPTRGNPPVENKKCKSGGARVSGKRSCARPGLAVPLQSRRSSRRLRGTSSPPAAAERLPATATSQRGGSGAPPPGRRVPCGKGLRADPVLGTRRSPEQELLFSVTVRFPSQLPKVAKRLFGVFSRAKDRPEMDLKCLLRRQPAGAGPV